MALQARCGLLARSIARDTFDCLLRASASNLSAVSSSGASTSRGRQSAQRISIRAMCDGPGFCMPSTADVPDVTPFWELKMSKRFTKMDFNQDGFITRKDLEAHMDKAIATGLYTDATIETMRAAYYNAWQRIWNFGMSRSAQKVSRREFMRGYANVVKDAMEREKLAVTLQGLLGSCFDQFDKCVHSNTPQGFLSEDEFVRYSFCWNLEEEESRRLYRDIDREQTGRVTKEQYLLAAWDFYFNMYDHHTPGNNFWGTLRSPRGSALVL